VAIIWQGMTRDGPFAGARARTGRAGGVGSLRAAAPDRGYGRGNSRERQRVGGGIRIWSPARMVAGSVICGFIARTLS
jgi:hypothetical protein